MSQNLWTEAATTIVNSGQIPIPVSDTLVELMQTLMTEEQAEFVRQFTKSMTLDEIKVQYSLDEASINQILDALMNEGVMTGIPSRSTGIVIYRLMPPLPGLFEYTLMRGETGDKQKKLAGLFDRLFGELSDLVQSGYDDFIPILKTIPAMTRVVPIEATPEEKLDTVMPYEDVKSIVDKFDTIAVSHCYCRHEKDLLGKSCKVTDDRKNCLLFGQTARFVIDYKFGEEISKDDAKKILAKAADDGLVHKTFHERQDIEKDEFAICNCCKCCCGTFELYYRGAAPANHLTSYIAEVDADECTGCETCIDACPMEAITMADDLAVIEGEKCIGCGVCVHQCPADSILLNRTGKRQAFVNPVRR